MKYFIQNAIYKSTDNTNDKYDHLIPAREGEYIIVDAWRCDKSGNVEPGAECPYPHHADSFGDIIGKVTQ